MRPRHAVLPTPSVFLCLPPKPHGIISFTDPHPLTLLESYRFKNSAGRGYSRHSLSAKPLPFNLFADPHRLTPVASISCKNHEGRGAAEIDARHSSLATALKSFLFTFFHILAHSFALTKTSTLLFSITSALFAQNHRGWGVGCTC